MQITSRIIHTNLSRHMVRSNNILAIDSSCYIVFRVDSNSIFQRQSKEISEPNPSMAKPAGLVGTVVGCYTNKEEESRCI